MKFMLVMGALIFYFLFQESNQRIASIYEFINNNIIVSKNRIGFVRPAPAS